MRHFLYPTDKLGLQLIKAGKLPAFIVYPTQLLDVSECFNLNSIILRTLIQADKNRCVIQKHLNK